MSQPPGAHDANSAATTTTTTTLNGGQERLVLRLRQPARKKVTWEEHTVDNEKLNRKSSKKCCIFHKQRNFDDGSSSDDDSDDENKDDKRQKRDDDDNIGAGPSGADPRGLSNGHGHDIGNDDEGHGEAGTLGACNGCNHSGDGTELREEDGNSEVDKANGLNSGTEESLAPGIGRVLDGDGESGNGEHGGSLVETGDDH